MLNVAGATMAIVAVGSAALAATPTKPPLRATASSAAHTSSAPAPGTSQKPAASAGPSAGGSHIPAVSDVVRVAGGASALLSFDSSHADKTDTAWAVRAFVETGSLEAAFASLVSGPDRRHHASLYCEPRTYGGRKGVVVSVALFGKDATLSEKLASGERVVVRVWQLHARTFDPPLQFRAETP